MSTITPVVWTKEDEVENDDSKEDGELSSVDSEVDELVDVDYNILPRPPTLASAGGIENKTSNDDGERAMDCSVMPSGTLDYSDDDDNPIRSDSSSDEDSDEPSSKKRSVGRNRHSYRVFSKPTPSFTNPNAFNNPYGVNNNTVPSQSTIPTIFPTSSSNKLPEGVTDADISTVEDKMRSYQEKRKSKNYNIWSDILQEEEQKAVLEKLVQVDVDSSKAIVERGPETYTYKISETNRKRKHDVPGTHKKDKNRPKRGDLDSDLSSTGLSDDDLEYLQNASRTCPTSTQPSIDMEVGKVEQEDSCSLEIEALTLSIKEMSDKVRKLRGRELCRYIAQQLKEQKYQLIVRACEILGKNYMIHMFLKTIKIEKKGGLLIKSKTRRRTPGGVFFYMIRKDDKYPSETIDLIFEIDRQISTKDKKQKTKARLLARKEKTAKFDHREVKFKDDM